MNVSDLEERLVAEGCNEANFALFSCKEDAICLDKDGDEWHVFYFERGHKSPLFSSVSEQKAFDYFYKAVTAEPHWHLVGWFTDEAEAVALENRLTEIDVKPIRNDIPAFRHEDDPRFRVFVLGKDIFKVRKHLGEQHIRCE